jgi:hypothetical protein
MDVAPETRHAAPRSEPAAGAPSAAGALAAGHAGEAALGAQGADPRRRWVLAACCTVACARMVDPKLWMMGLEIPVAAFGAGWEDYRVFSTVTTMLLLVCLLFGGLLGDYFGRRRV